MSTFRTLLTHLLAPALVTVAGLGLALGKEPLGVELLFSHLAWGLLFYAAPHLMWAALCAALRPSHLVRHAGFFVCSLALAAVCAVAVFGPRDPSGLPYQWLVYWPLAAVGLVAVVIGWFLAGRPHAAA